MSEANYRERVRKRLKGNDALHWEANTGGMNSNGRPDTYIDGPRSDLWVEWKYVDAMPRSGIVDISPKEGAKKQPRGRLSPLQLRWLERRRNNAVALREGNAVAIAALPDGRAVVMTTPTEWRKGVPVDRAKSIEEVVAWVSEFCGGS